MKGKLLFVAGAAVGYVLGTRAGRERYEQIKGAAESVWNTPVVQQGVGQVKDFALARVGTVSDAFFDNAKKLVNAATNQAKASNGHASRDAKPAASKPSASKSAASKPSASTSATSKSTASKSSTQKSEAAEKAAATPKSDD